jgi:ABC-type phosphate/phosphonate transport system substrate-binding protein
MHCWIFKEIGEIAGNRPALCAAVMSLILFSLLSPPHVNGEKGGEESDMVQKPTLIVGYSSQLFSHVDVNDAKAATTVWTDILISKKGIFKKTNTVIIQDIPSLEKAVKAKAVDIVILLPQEFIEIRNKVPLEPVFSSAISRGVYEEFILLVRKDQGIEKLSDLRGKRLLVETGQRGTIPAFWLDILLTREKLPEGKEFFSSVREANRISQAVLPVFFRQADACLASRYAFETMSELNPQVGKELKAIATSPGFLTGVICFRRDFYAQFKDHLDDSLKSLHIDSQGRQILTLFRINQLIPFEHSHLETVEALLKEHQGLRVRLAKRK